jgi:hypothetical protein
MVDGGYFDYAQYKWWMVNGDASVLFSLPTPLHPTPPLAHSETVSPGCGINNWVEICE